DRLAELWVQLGWVRKYSYGFTCLGRPIIQLPDDMVRIQEAIFQVKPDVIVETGIAHGGSLVFDASMLELLGGDGYVVGIDIDIRAHNRSAIEAHPMAKRIRMIEGSSIDPEIVRQVGAHAAGKGSVMVILDSNHTHEHVLAELQLYAPLVTAGSYCVVFDTSVEDAPEELFLDRPWGKGNNPKTAVWEFLRQNDAFEIDRSMENKALITVAPDGFLRRVKG
ncbi:MAG: Cephalosporin hydroxylase, partial [Acidobacteria bacterium]|nr:Cephalosporin hydroxylase [Acidobacteriota bacterium]